MSGGAMTFDAYRKVNVETASQGKLIVMLFNGMIQRAEEAKRMIGRKEIESAHKNLIRAQDIIAELRGALDMKVGEVSANLDRIYEYIQHLLIQANIRKNTAHIDEAVALATDLRDTWEQVFLNIAKEGSAVPKTPSINQHGSSVINVQG